MAGKVVCKLHPKAEMDVVVLENTATGEWTAWPFCKICGEYAYKRACTVEQVEEKTEDTNESGGQAIWDVSGLLCE
jgi:hypothetical protein